MTRRFDFALAEKVSLALLTKAAFGTDAGLRYAKLAHLPTRLVAEVFRRPIKEVRKDIPTVHMVKERRSQTRD